MKTDRRHFIGSLGGLGLTRTTWESPTSAERAVAEAGDQGGLAFSYFRGQPLRIGNDVQLLADDYVVEDRWMLKRRVGQVLKHAGNPILGPSKPWEDRMGMCPSVLYDAKLGKYRMWYQCFSLSDYFSRKGPAYYIGYAESEDGFSWAKPELEGFPFNDYPRTNIVTTGRGGRRASAMQVQLNPDQSDAARRFMMIYIGAGSVDLAYSPDGFRWTIVDEPLFRYHSDCPNHLLWVPERGLWYAYVRPSIRPNGMGSLPEGLRHTGRRLAMSTSPDLKEWSMPRTILYADERDQPDYDNVYVFRRHGLFFAMIAQMFQEQGGPQSVREVYDDDPTSSSSQNETYLATSRDGIQWERTWDRAPFIPRGPEGSFDRGQAKPGTGQPIERREDLLLYYHGSPHGQSRWDREGNVGIARLRLDRFIGQMAGEQTGYLLTRQFRLEGTGLELNCSALPIPYQHDSDGIRVAILEEPDFQTRETSWEKAVPGFGLAECDNIVTDALKHRVSWKGNSDLSSLKGRPIYLRFQMKKAALYSFRIVP